MQFMQYMPRHMHSLCRSWGKRTLVTLIFNEHHWAVELLRTNDSFRLGIGWNDFTYDMNLEAGNMISFEYIGNFNFQVTFPS